MGQLLFLIVFSTIHSQFYQVESATTGLRALCEAQTGADGCKVFIDDLESVVVRSETCGNFNNTKKACDGPPKDKKGAEITTGKEPADYPWWLQMARCTLDEGCTPPAGEEGTAAVGEAIQKCLKDEKEHRNGYKTSCISVFDPKDPKSVNNTRRCYRECVRWDGKIILAALFKLCQKDSKCTDVMDDFTGALGGTGLCMKGSPSGKQCNKAPGGATPGSKGKDVPRGTMSPPQIDTNPYWLQMAQCLVTECTESYNRTAKANNKAMKCCAKNSGGYTNKEGKACQDVFQKGSNSSEAKTVACYKECFKTVLKPGADDNCDSTDIDGGGEKNWDYGDADNDTFVEAARGDAAKSESRVLPASSFCLVISPLILILTHMI